MSTTANTTTIITSTTAIITPDKNSHDLQNVLNQLNSLSIKLFQNIINQSKKKPLCYCKNINCTGAKPKSSRKIVPASSAPNNNIDYKLQLYNDLIQKDLVNFILENTYFIKVNFILEKKIFRVIKRHLPTYGNIITKQLSKKNQLTVLTMKHNKNVLNQKLSGIKLSEQLADCTPLTPLDSGSECSTEVCENEFNEVVCNINNEKSIRTPTPIDALIDALQIKFDITENEHIFHTDEELIKIVEYLSG